jgi:hypothetical protein
MGERIRMDTLTEKQFFLIFDRIDLYLKNRNIEGMPECWDAEDYWDGFVDEETGLQYDLNMYIDDLVNETHVNLYNVENNSTDTSTESEQHVWRSSYWSLEACKRSYMEEIRMRQKRGDKA